MGVIRELLYLDMKLDTSAMLIESENPTICNWNSFVIIKLDHSDWSSFAFNGLVGLMYLPHGDMSNK
jgi:hypothetical protein